jgi:hypothetical protein
VLIDNYKQARKCMEVQEKQLIRSRRFEEFNSQFYDMVERVVFQKLSLQEIVGYTGPVNYITMVEALKNDPPHHHSAADLHEQQHEAAYAIQEVAK